MKSIAPIPLLIDIQELKTSHFATSISMNVIQPDYCKIISLPFEGKRGIIMLYHPSLKLINSSTMNRGRAA